MYETRDWTDVGGLISYGAGDSELYRRAAHFVDKILRGAKPADLPVEQPTKFELVINLKTSRRDHPVMNRSPAGGIIALIPEITNHPLAYRMKAPNIRRPQA